MTNEPGPEKAPRVAFDIDETGECAELAALLGREIAEKFGPREETPFSILARDRMGALAGGLNGVFHWRWLYVRHLWVAEGARGEGLGRDLIERAEAAAKARGAIGVYLDTFDEGAAQFYEKCGFQRCGRIEGFPAGFARVFLARRVQDGAARSP